MRNHTLFIFIALISLTLLNTVSQAAALRIPGVKDDPSFPPKLLLAIIERSDQLTHLEHPHHDQPNRPFSKTEQDLEDGNLDIVWTATSREYEERFSAIYFPVYGGALGWRISLLPNSKANTLSYIDKLRDLQQFIPCQGKLWADTAILEANGFTVAKSLGYQNLFTMLDGDRCDFFPRALFEPWNEQAQHRDLNLQIDPSLLLQYQLPSFFFVAKHRKDLAQHLEETLQALHQDGTYLKLLLSDNSMKTALQKAHLTNRKKVVLSNPFLSDQVKRIPNTYWLDPLALSQQQP